MRVLIVGAGATGGAFGALLQEAGRDVTYLVRPARAEALRRNGLRVVSPERDRTHRVRVLVAGESADAFDLVLLTVKAGGLEQAIADLGPFVGPETRLLPILNGVTHVARLEEAFPGQVLGGVVKIVATLDDGVVRQLTPMCTFTVGALDGGDVPAGVAAALDVPGLVFSVSLDVVGTLWEKWTFIAAAGVVACLFRGPIGAIVEAGGRSRIEEVIAEAESVAAAAGHPVSGAAHRQSLAILTEPGSVFTSSLYRDLIAGLPHEGEHILGALAAEARRLALATPFLDLALIQIRTADVLRAAV